MNDNDSVPYYKDYTVSKIYSILYQLTSWLVIQHLVGDKKGRKKDQLEGGGEVIYEKIVLGG